MKRPGIALVLSLAAFLAAAPARADNKPNPFGITMVRFQAGTPAAAMRASVAQAGGSVVTDLTPVNALAVAPLAPDFATRMKANASVSSVFTEPIFRAPLGGDFQPGGGAVNPVFGPAPAFPDPWHDASSFLGVSNPQGILQWDDARMNVPAAWARTLGDRSIRVAVLDTGIESSHRELRDNVEGSHNFIPCDTLTRDFGAAAVKQLGLRDCSNQDGEGHGTWVASRIAAELNGFASNGVAPRVRVSSYKVLAAGFGGMPDWILAGLVSACSSGVDLVNMSIAGYLDPSDPSGAQTYLLFNDAVQYCRSRGVTVFAAAGNEHVRVDRVTISIGSRVLSGAGRVSAGPEGIGTVAPGSASLSGSDLRGKLLAPAGVPGVVMVSATNNANDPAPADDPFGASMQVGARDQLAYYSNYGSRVDLAAPGGARRFNLPFWDGGSGDILYGGFGSLGALAETGTICSDPVESSLANFACFKVEGNGFGWLQGTSMASPNAVGVAALALSARPELRHNPAALVARLETTAQRQLTNFTGPDDPANLASTYDGRACPTGYCHLDPTHPVGFADAYGAGLIDAGAAVNG
ncbi:MAG TPA: S8 family serine peptidase [Gaiellaceae bacterium]